VLNTTIWLEYLANQDFIKTVLCINKEQPKLDCNGKCYLMQQLRQNESEQEQKIPKTEAVKIELFVTGDSDSTNVVFGFNADYSPFDLYKIPSYHSYLKAVFHPPRM